MIDELSWIIEISGLEILLELVNVPDVRKENWKLDTIHKCGTCH